MKTTAHSLHLAALLMLGGCAMAEYDATEAPSDSADSQGVSDYLRVDVFPSDQNAGLLPETHVLDEEWEGLQLELSTPVTVYGSVTGYDATPHLDIQVPGSTAPVAAHVWAYKDGTVMAGGDYSDLLDADESEHGAFEFKLPVGDGYTFAAVPQGEEELPFLVQQGVEFEAGIIEYDVELAYGVPLYGRIANESGLPIPDLDLSVRAIDAETGIEGPATTPDVSGYYLLRVVQGHRYQVVLSGAEGELVPTVTQELTVEDEQGAELDFTLGAIDPLDVSGQLLYAESTRAVEGALVRFTALELEEHPGGDLVVDDITSSQGEYRTSLLPGRYKVEYIAPSSLELSPQQEVLEFPADGPSEWENPDLELHGLNTVSCQVLDPGGDPLAGVSVVATEQGFDGYTYSATTDDNGYFELPVPLVKMSFTLTPPEGQAAVSYIDVHVDDFPPIILLEQGQAISGAITHGGKEAVSLALVEVRDSEGQLYATTITDDEGLFQVRVAWEDAQVSYGLDLPADTAYLD